MPLPSHVIRIAASAWLLGTAVPPAQAPAHVAVTGNEYAFPEFPKAIAAGPTLFTFENRGHAKHEMSIVRLKNGVTLQDVMGRGPGAASSKAMAEQLMGILIARQGEAAGGQLLLPLESGQRYLVICTLRDTPDAKPHAELGMVATFDVP